MADVLAVVEQRGGRVLGVSREVVTAAKVVANGLGGSVHALVVGGPGLSGSVSELGAYGAERILVAEGEGLDRFQAESHAEVVARVAEGDYAAVLFAASAQGKDLAPRVAARLDVPLASDVTGIDTRDGRLRVTRPVYGGKAFSHITFEASPALFSVRPNLFAPEENLGAGSVETVDATVAAPGVRLVDFNESGESTVDVAEASIVVAGGRGMKDPENWSLLEDLRDAVGEGAGLGASRAVVDAGWRPHGEQVGQTGKTVAPKLYFAVGISGAIQHLAGMRTAGTIVAINKDADAPIFQVADYGIVGDLFEVLPRLTEEVRALKAGG